MRQGGHFHFPGPVKTIGTGTFTELVGRVGEVLKEVQGLKILIPPLPRHLDTPCCGLRDHCTNLSDPNYSSSALNAYTELRKILKTVLLSKVSNFRVLDGIGAVAGYGSDQNRPGNDNIALPLKQVYARDGVHLNHRGLQNLVAGIVGIIKNSDTGALPVSGGRQLSHSWHGFLSVRGSSLKPRHAGGQRWRGRRFNPYSKK